jgi:hypothetical protein
MLPHDSNISITKNELRVRRYLGLGPTQPLTAQAQLALQYLEHGASFEYAITFATKATNPYPASGDIIQGGEY